MSGTKALYQVLLLVLLLGAVAVAQNTASIKGTVADPSGAAIVGAKITISGPLGIERTTQTSASGDYEVPALPPGSYTIEVRKDGFQTEQAKDVVLEVSNNTVQSFSLKVATTSEVVTVEAKAPVVETTTMTVGQTINQNTVQEIPLNGRHFVDLALLIPGTVTPPQNGFLTAPLRGQGSFAFNTAGMREDAINFMINGINLNDMVQNQVTYQPVINTVAEFKVDNSTYSAEYGRNAGSIVNIATRSGTDQFHGELYDYLRNNDFDARNAFNPVLTSSGAPNPQSPFKRNQFGGDFGGPIRKGKTYFFLSYEGERHRQGLNTASDVFSPAQVALIQASPNPIVKGLGALVPGQNGTINGAPAFLGSATAPVNIDQGTADISHNFSDADTLHGYWAYQNDLREEPTQGANIPGFGDTRAGHRQVLTVNETHVFSSDFVNEARIGANRIHILFTPNNTTDPNSLGLGNILGPNLAFVPTISIADLGLTFGDERGFPQGRGDTTGVLGDTVSYIKGRHSIKFGGEFRDFRNDNFNGDPGTLTFSTTADFINGLEDRTAARTVGNVANRISQGALDFFVQDSFKFTSYLTLELGVRYAWNMTPSEADTRFVNFDPATASLVTASSPYAQNNKNFQPRVGFAWDIFHNGTTILRGGYAYQVDQPITGFVTGLSSNPPFALPISVAASTGTPIPLANLATSFNGTPGSISPTAIASNFTNADVQSFNLNLQRQIGRNASIMVGYFGNKGTHLEVDQNINQTTVLGQVAAGNLALPFPILAGTSAFLPGDKLASTILAHESDGNSTYNALWVTANKHFSRGFQFNASYTWSHSIDDVSRNNNGIVVQNSTNIFASKGSSDFDARQRFVVNAIYDLPFQGNRVVAGWELATIVSDQSGNPFNVVQSSSGITGVGGTVNPNVSGPVVTTGNPLGNWFATPTVFISPGATALGIVGRNEFVGPAFNDVDFSIIKNTKITERTRVQFRVDAFDLLNHPNYGQPNSTIGNFATLGQTTNAFGTISSTRQPTGDSGSSRQLQFALKMMF
jgi:hypothetical protein